MRALALILAVTACGVDDPTDDPAGPGGGKSDDPSTFVLPGYDETMLAGGTGGKLALIHVGDTFALTALATGETDSPEVIATHGGMFHALYRDGSLVVIDPEAKKIASRVELGAGALDVAWIGETVFVTQGDAIAKWELGTVPRQIGRVDLAPARGTASKIELRRMRALGTRLFVQVARWSASNRPAGGAVAVIDTTHDVIETVIELSAIDDTNAGLTGLSPDAQLALDEQRGILYVTALGDRPSNTGGLFRIDAARAKLLDATKAQSGFQGTAVVGAASSRAFIIYHTSTPTTSSHLFDFRITDTNALESIDGPALVDTFDGLDALAINGDGTLVAMSNTCITGFCIKGAGIAFVDAHTSKLLPKLLKATLGFEPSIAAFLD